MNRLRGAEAATSEPAAAGYSTSGRNMSGSQVVRTSAASKAAQHAGQHQSLRTQYAHQAVAPRKGTTFTPILAGSTPLQYAAQALINTLRRSTACPRRYAASTEFSE